MYLNLCKYAVKIVSNVEIKQIFLSIQQIGTKITWSN